MKLKETSFKPPYFTVIELHTSHDARTISSSQERTKTRVQHLLKTAGVDKREHLNGGGLEIMRLLNFNQQL